MSGDKTIPNLANPAAPNLQTVIDSLKGPYQLVVNEAQNIERDGGNFNLRAIADKLLVDISASIIADSSQAVRDLCSYARRQAVVCSRTNNYQYRSVPVAPPDSIKPVDVRWVQYLNPSADLDRQLVAEIKNVSVGPIGRPPSPGPARPAYFIPCDTKAEQIPVLPNDNLFSPFHPQRVDMSVIRRFPFPLHPNEIAESAMSSVPLSRLWANGALWTPEQGVTCANNTVLGICEKETVRACEDRRHFEAFPVCQDCDLHGRARSRTDDFAREIRAYLCSECTYSVVPLLNKLKNQGHFLWADNPLLGHSLPTLKADSITANGLTARAGGWQGPPNQFTGCGCGVKLWNRVLCNPHRTQYILDMKGKAAEMKLYCKQLYGKSVCPLCRINPGVDQYHHIGSDGGEGNPIEAWVCLNCHAYAIVPKGKQSTNDWHELVDTSHLQWPYGIGEMPKYED